MDNLRSNPNSKSRRTCDSCVTPCANLNSSRRSSTCACLFPSSLNCLPGGHCIQHAFLFGKDTALWTHDKYFVLRSHTETNWIFSFRSLPTMNPPNIYRSSSLRHLQITPKSILVGDDDAAFYAVHCGRKISDRMKAGKAVFEAKIDGLTCVAKCWRPDLIQL